MNKLIYILFFFLFTILVAFSQNNNVDSFFEKYSNLSDFKAVVMNDPASVIMQNESGDEADISKDLLKGIKTIKALTYKSAKDKVSPDGKNFSSELAKFNAGEGFTEIMSLNEGHSKIKSIIRKSGDKVTEFIMIVAGANESTLIWINGDINLKNVANIGRLLQLRESDKPGRKK
jgi:hypothetical protein